MDEKDHDMWRDALEGDDAFAEFLAEHDANTRDHMDATYPF